MATQVKDQVDGTTPKDRTKVIEINNDKDNNISMLTSKTQDKLIVLLVQ